MYYLSIQSSPAPSPAAFWHSPNRGGGIDRRHTWLAVQGTAPMLIKDATPAGTEVYCLVSVPIYPFGRHTTRRSHGAAPVNTTTSIQYRYAN